MVIGSVEKSVAGISVRRGSRLALGLGPARGCVVAGSAGGDDGGGRRIEDHLASGRHGRGTLLLDWGAEDRATSGTSSAEVVGAGSDGHFTERPVHVGVAAGKAVGRGPARWPEARRRRPGQDHSVSPLGGARPAGGLKDGAAVRPGRGVRGRSVRGASRAWRRTRTPAAGLSPTTDPPRGGMQRGADRTPIAACGQEEQRSAVRVASG